MTIGQTIRQLLEKGNKVIFPGFGNLEISTSGGGSPVTGKQMPPPGTTIRFDSGFSKDDGMLAAAFAADAGTGEDEATQQVLELVDRIKFALDKGEEYPVEAAGTFSRDDDGKIHFRPVQEWVLEPDQYGLEPMELLELDDAPAREAEGAQDNGAHPPGVQESEEAEKVPAEVENDPENQTDHDTRAEPAGVEEAPAKKDPSPEESPVGYQPSKPPPPKHEPWKREAEKKSKRQRPNAWRVVWWIAGALIVILLVLILIPSDTLDRIISRDTPEPGTEQPATEPGTAAEETIGEGTVPSTAPEEETAPAGEVDETGIPAREPEEAVAEPPPAHRYFIIAGSFRHLANASELQDNLKARGYEAEVMVTENHMYRVSVASFAGKTEAETGLARIRSEVGLESSWLLSNE